MKKEKLFLSNKNIPENEYSQRIFKGMYVENPAIQYLVFVPLIILLTVHAFIDIKMTWWEYGLVFLGSLGFWTVFEYVTHRYFFHANPKSTWMRKLLDSMHWAHHEYPNDSRVMLINPLISVPVAGALALIVSLIIGVYVLPFMAGIMSIYLLYDWFHFASHNKNYNNWWFQMMKRHHMKHHYQDNLKNYGFTTTVWDKILDTDIEEPANKQQVSVESE